jgi:plastocyanin
MAAAAHAEKAKRAAEKAPVSASGPAVPGSAEATRPTTTTPVAKPPRGTASPAVSQTLSGTITLLGGGKEITDPADMADTAVYFVPEGGAPHPTPGRFRIYTHGKQFEPSTLVVPLGSTISFPNLDTILHNVFSVSPGANFDLGLLAEGKSGEYTFTKAGTVFINCNVHQLMQANVLVVDTPYVTRPNNSGNFKLTGLPSGPGMVWTWNPRANAQALAVTLPATNGIELRVVMVRARLVQHLNKENKPY